MQFTINKEGIHSLTSSILSSSSSI